MKVISIVNLKGGTGKTTTTSNLGAALARKGFKVLLIDTDSQCNLGLINGVGKASDKHIGSLLMDTLDFQEVVVKLDNLDIVPSSDALMRYEYMLNQEPGGEFLMKLKLKSLNYDFVLIDCPPSLGPFTLASLVASDYYIIPLQGEHLTYIGLDKIMDNAKKIKSRMNTNLELAGTLLIKFDTRTKFGQAIHQKLSANPQLRLFTTVIRQDVALMECTAFQQNIFDYDPLSRGSEDFQSLSKEILEKYG